MPADDPIRNFFSGGDRRSLGRSGEGLALIREQPKRVSEIVELLWDDDAVVRMRAADVLEKVSRGQAGLLSAYRAELLGLMAEAGQKELRWHLAAILPRLALTPLERRRVEAILESYLEDSSSIVKTMAMQGLWDLSSRDAAMRLRVAERIRTLARSGTAAMRARARKLLREQGFSEER